MAKKDGKSILDYLKYLYSTCLLVFCTVLVMGLIFSHNTKLAHDVHPALAFCVLWACLLWLNMVEGSQGCLVGLPPVNRDFYQTSHPITHTCCTVAHQGDNLDRYLTGRQFLVIFIVFVSNLAGAPLPELDAHNDDVLGLPQWLFHTFLSSGLALILLTAMAGQLNSQVNASHCMLDYVNNYFALVTLYTALAVEFTGMFHACHALQMILAKAAGKPIASQEAPRTTTQLVFFWARVFLSLAIVAFGLAVTLTALLEGKTTVWKGVPPAVAIVLFVLCLALIGLLEGMQIAFFAVAKLPKDERGSHVVCQKTCHLLFRKGGRNLPGFMIGRQVCVTACFFLVARIASMNVHVEKGDESIFGVSRGLQEFFNTGILAAILTTMLGSIANSLVASAFPIAFLTNPAVYLLLHLCLVIEATGVCSGAWILAAIHARLAGYQRDECYIGTPEERAAQSKEDHSEFQQVEPGHARLPVFRAGTNQVGNYTIAEHTEYGEEELDTV